MFFIQSLSLSESCLLVHIKNSHKNCIKSINQLITNYCLYYKYIGTKNILYFVLNTNYN